MGNSQRKQILDALRAVTSAGDRLLVIHSSLFSLRLNRDGLKWDCLWALRKLMEGGSSIAIPTFTLSFCKGKQFHIRDSKSETGVLGDWFLELPEVSRTRHPIYSFAVGGELAGDMLNCRNSTTFGPDSLFCTFDKLNARVIMFGCDWKYLTLVHHYEEEVQSPHRQYKDFVGIADYGNGPATVSARMFVRKLEVNPANDLSGLVQDLKSHHKIATYPLHHGTVQSASSHDISEAGRRLLEADTLAFVRYPQAIRYQLQESAQRLPLRVALLGARNLDLLNRTVRETLQTYVRRRDVQVYNPPFGRMLEQILTADSELTRYAADVTFFMDRLEDVAQVEDLEELNDAVVDEKLSDYISAVRTYANSSNAAIFVSTFAELQRTAIRRSHVPSADGSQSILQRSNERLVNELADLRNVHFFDMTQAALVADARPAFDPRLWDLGRIPISAPFAEYLARRLSGFVLATIGQSTRLIVVDLDNTLWGGVVGEDGVNGLQIGGDYPGNAFLRFQKTLQKLLKRGIALAVCSKNDEDLALRAMRERTEMVIRADDLAAFRINWLPKWQNISAIAEELNLGLENVLFIDDNPAERQQMLQYQPAVKVLDLPEDPSLYSRALLESPYLEYARITREDLGRVEAYKGLRESKKFQSQFVRQEDFYASLQGTVSIESLTDDNVARAEQLLAKTNQFNTTTRRYSRQDLFALTHSGVSVFVVGYADRFLQKENIGLAIIRWHDAAGFAEIDSFLLSCRVLGRGIDVALLNWIGQQALSRGMRSVRGQIIVTERNTPVRSLYKDHGFVLTGNDDEWSCDLEDGVKPAPEWIRIEFTAQPNQIIKCAP